MFSSFRAGSLGRRCGYVHQAGPSKDLLAARSRGVGVATEMLLTKAEQVSDDGACAPDYAS